MKILQQLRRASRHLDKVRDPGEVARRVAAVAQGWRELASTDWGSASAEQRGLAAAKVKEAVVEQLIPAASAVSMFGVPGILVYTPCQLAGALALVHIRTNDNVLKPEHLKTAAGVVIWGKLGQLVWVNVADLLKPLLTPPVVSLALLPFVQGWTRAILDQVEERYVQPAPGAADQ